MRQPEISYIADGISQSERYPDSLKPDFFQVEERDKEDLLKFVIEFGQHLHYYNLNNEIEGDWEEILTADVMVIMRVIPKFEINTFIRRYEQLKSVISDTAPDVDNIRALGRLLHFLYSFLSFQRTIHRKFTLASHNSKAFQDFRKMMESYDVFEEEMNLWEQYSSLARDTFGDEIPTPVFRRDRSEQLIGTPVTMTTLKGGHIKAKMDHLLPELDQLFARLRTKFTRLSEAAELYRYKQKDEGDLYEPHIALLMTFLDLYDYLKQDINQLTKKHLDLYYKKILGIKQKEAVPDKAHLVVTLNPAFEAYTLEKGTLFVAKDPVTGNDIHFETDNELAVSPASICELNTVFVSESVKIPAKTDEQDDVNESQVYMASNPPNPPDGVASESWPLLGEDQMNLPFENRSMQPADTGLLIASPLLYARDGKRNFKVLFFITDDSAAWFWDHISNFSEVSGMRKKWLFTEMLTQAFHISLTSDSGWLDITKYTVSPEYTIEGNKCFELNFWLGHNEPGIGCYQQSMHGYHCDTNWPMIRFLINNNSFHNPYTFLSHLNLQRVGLELDVYDSQHVKLQNNIGSLSALSPFQLFGPQPTIGSYLDVYNANMFNRYTSKITMRLHWFDLPRDKGGFETYYQSYNKKIKNDSFRVGVSCLNEGRYQPAKPENREVYHLFEMGTEPGSTSYLNPVSTLEEIDLSRLRFTNTPTLSDEGLATESGFRDGAVRFELLSPEDGFGHKIFPGLFPEVIMNNARRFSKKIPLPNQPYIPVVSRISIDYNLKHTEPVAGINREQDDLQNLRIWHHTPFGNKKIYPCQDMQGKPFIPVLKYPHNLFIGLSGVKPDDMLTLLFEVEDYPFSHARFVPDKIQWSVLRDDQWIDLLPSDILIDSTSNFITSGVVKLRLPDYDMGTHTIFNPDYYWIKAASRSRGGIITRVKGVYTHAVTATRVLKNDETEYNRLSLPAGVITEPDKRIPAIQQVSQPFPTYGGKEAEPEDKYYTRVSERLRHKQRPLTTTDFAQLILEAFPEIIKVHCFQPVTDEAACDMQMIVIPRYDAGQGDIPEEPKVSLSRLYLIKQLVVKNLVPFVRVEVTNPVYERVKVVCSVIFNSNFTHDTVGNNINRLNHDIRKFISPWLYNADADVKMESKTYLSEILNFIKKLPYVSHVTSFSVLHFYTYFDKKEGEWETRVNDSAVQRIEYIKGSQPGSILISAPEHEITVLENKVYDSATQTGIGALVIGEELLIGGDATEGENPDQYITGATPEDEYDFYFNPNT